MFKQEIVVYKSGSRAQVGFLQIWFILVRNAINSRELIFQLFKRDFLMAYQKSFLGFGWLFITPLVTVTSWVLMNYAGIISPGVTQIPYPAFVLISTTLWTLFLEFYQNTAKTLNIGATFINQVKFSHDVLLVKQGLQTVVNFLFALCLTFIILAFFKVFPNLGIILLPIMILPIFFLAATIGLAVAVVSAISADFEKIVTFFMGLLMFITPIIYTPDVKNELLKVIITWNPLSYLIGEMRNMLLYGKMDNFNGYLLASLSSWVLFTISWRLFYISEEKVIEKMI